MRPPIIAIIGRPNVGKSTLLNAWAGRRLSIVDPTPGVTRDRVGALVARGEWLLEAVDTGGVGVVDAQHLEAHIERQIAFALKEAAVVVFLVDAREGVTPLDLKVADVLRRRAGPLLLCANKCETREQEENAAEFFRLGLGEPLCISAQEGLGAREALDRALTLIPPESRARADAVERAPLLAIVGKRNSGKSTFVNTLAGCERVIVSEIPGSTRDSVDVRVEFDGRALVIIDTAGLRRAKAVTSSIDFYSQHRAQRSIRRADMVLLLTDCREHLSKVDKAAGQVIALEAKPVVIAVNKWDLAGAVTPERYQRYVRRRLPGLDFAPIAFLSGLTGLNVRETIRLALDLYGQASYRAPTAEVNRVLQEAVARRQPRAEGRIKPRIYYATQPRVNPPTFALFVNNPAWFDQAWLRYLANRFREAFPLREVPVKIVLRERAARARRTSAADANTTATAAPGAAAPDADAHLFSPAGEAPAESLDEEDVELEAALVAGDDGDDGDGGDANDGADVALPPHGAGEMGAAPGRAGAEETATSRRGREAPRPGKAAPDVRPARRKFAPTRPRAKPGPRPPGPRGLRPWNKPAPRPGGHGPRGAGGGGGGGKRRNR